MYAITTPNELVQIEQKKAVVSVLIAQRYDQQLLSWVGNCWDQLHSDSGMNWHIVVPVKISAHQLYDGTFTNLAQTTFNTELARWLMSMYGISRKKLPAIVFDDFNEEKRQRFIRLKKFDDAALADVFQSCAELVNRAGDAPFSDRQRASISDSIVDEFNAREIGGVTLHIAKRAASAIPSLLRSSF